MSAPLPDPSARVRNEQAALWCLRDAEGDLDERGHAALDEWLSADPANAAAFANARIVWQQAGMAAETPEMIPMRSRAVEMLRTASVRQWSARSWLGRPAASAIAACVALFLFSALLFWHGGVESYRTAAGERRVVMLADGTRMTLDGATRVDVRLERDRRRLTLVSGRAKFDVAHDPLRPLSVLAADRLTVATGTAFSVELLRREMRVILYQGKVEVVDGARDERSPDRPTPMPGAIALTAGHELIAATGGRAVRVARADTERSLTWESGMLTFVNEPLATAVERMNRGTTRKLLIGDAKTAGYRISGDFTEGDADAFIEGVAALYDLRISQGPDGTVLLVRGRNEKVQPASV